MWNAVPLKYKKSCTTLSSTVSGLNPNARNLNYFCDEIIDIPIRPISNKYEHGTITLDPGARNVELICFSFSEVIMGQIESIITALLPL